MANRSRIRIGGSISCRIANGAGAAYADQVPAQYSGPTEPAKAPEKLKVTAITCLSILHGCVSPAVGLQHAGEALGWDVTVVDGGGNPSKQNSAILDAVSAGSKVIVLVAVDPAAVQLGLKAAKDAGVLVVSGSNGIDTPNPVDEARRRTHFGSPSTSARTMRRSVTRQPNGSSRTRTGRATSRSFPTRNFPLYWRSRRDFSRD